MPVDQSLVARIASSLRTSRASLPPTDTAPGAPVGNTGIVGASARGKDSILVRAGDLYASRPSEEKTPPTGFDPRGAVLFEALVEAAYLVAVSDGDFDAEERRAFEEVVVAATDGRVGVRQLGPLLTNLEASLSRDGVDRRFDTMSRAVVRTEQQHEVLRVAALIASISGGISSVERAAIERLAQGFGLNAADVKDAVDHAERALSGSG